jgi:hypothetical protein
MLYRTPDSPEKRVNLTSPPWGRAMPTLQPEERYVDPISVDPLSPIAQVMLRDRYASSSLEGIDRYQWYDLPDGTVLKGGWDLRETWREYLGNFDFTGKRVLEVGPSAGFISLMIEKAGGDVVALDLQPDQPQDLILVPGQDIDLMRANAIPRIERFKRAWWSFHQLYGSRNKAVYADIYNLPTTLGRFDVAVFASVLLHMQNPCCCTCRTPMKLCDKAPMSQTRRSS